MSSHTNAPARDRLVGLALVALALHVSSCAVNPVTGSRELVLMTEAQEIQMGAASDPSIVAQFGVLDDPGITAWAATIAPTSPVGSKQS